MTRQPRQGAPANRTGLDRQLRGRRRVPRGAACRNLGAVPEGRVHAAFRRNGPKLVSDRRFGEFVCSATVELGRTGLSPVSRAPVPGAPKKGASRPLTPFPSAQHKIVLRWGRFPYSRHYQTGSPAFAPERSTTGNHHFQPRVIVPRRARDCQAETFASGPASPQVELPRFGGGVDVRQQKGPLAFAPGALERGVRCAFACPAGCKPVCHAS